MEKRINHLIKKYRILASLRKEAMIDLLRDYEEYKTKGDFDNMLEKFSDMKLNQGRIEVLEFVIDDLEKLVK